MWQQPARDSLLQSDHRGFWLPAAYATWDVISSTAIAAAAPAPRRALDKGRTHEQPLRVALA